MSIKSLTVHELQEKLSQKENLVLVDCREIHEWNNGHIPEAIHIPLSDFENQSKILEDKDAQIILQCRSGQRSMRAAYMLEGMGYKNLSNLEGGILDWTGAGFPVTPPEL